MIPLEETSAIPSEKANPQSATTPARTPEGKAIEGAAREPDVESRSPKFLGWEQVLHLSQPMVAAGQIPHPSRGPKLMLCNWEERVVQIP